MNITALDHLVLTVADPDATVAFYERLGMHREVFGDGRLSLRFGDQKINLHRTGEEIEPHARRATPGSADLCLLVLDPIEEIDEALAAAGVAVELGPVERTGATSALISLYVRDPDGNLVELSRPDDDATRHQRAAAELTAPAPAYDREPDWSEVKEDARGDPSPGR